MTRPGVPGPPEYRKRVRATVLWCSTAEGLFIFLAVNLLVNIGRNDLTVAAIAAIVGVHFYPMAVGLRVKVYWITATAMVGLAAAALFLPAGVERDAVIGCGCALILWLSSIALMRTLRSPEVAASLSD
jgi:hypothetical protein